MDAGKSWFRTHWRTGLSLVLIFGIALFLRVYFVYDLAFTEIGLTCGPDSTLPVSGGSDSYYWHRALCYSYDTGKDLDFDTMLNFGWGNDNPRPPLFPWFSLLAGKMIAPLFADPWHAVLFVFLLSTGLFGALTVFPAYLLTKEAFGRRAGLVAALLLAVSSAHMQRSQATDADHDAWTLFFVVTTFYFFLRSLKVMQPRRWVENWSKRETIGPGVRAFFAENRKSVLYAALAGLCIAVIALSWQGWAYVPVILLVYFVVQLFLDRVRNNDTLALTILFGIAMVIPLLLAFPWYAARNQIRVWFDVPAYLFLVAAVLGAAFTVTRDYPWTLVIPSTIVAGAAGLGVGVLVNPALASAFVSGAGYFVQTKVYETIAEAQAPGLSQLILSFGFFTFYFSIAAVGYMVWQIPKRRDAAYTVIVIWAFAAIFMAMAAARFIFNASPAFAVTAAFAIDLIITRADFAGMRRTYRSLVSGSWRNAVRKSLKIRHVLVVVLIVGAVLLPNVWWGVDSAIPFELKSRYDRQVHDALPPFLRAPGYDASGAGTFYFGAFGYSVPQPTEYFPAAWRWFRTQDADRPPELRPAFLSWWDYGFEAIDRGQHPTVADNFQNGFAFAGQFITAQNESQAISLLAVRLLESDVRRHAGRFSPSVEAVLDGFGLPVTNYRNAILRPLDLVPIIRSNPTQYGVWDSQIQPLNALYIFMSRDALFLVGEDRLVELYRSLRTATGQEIGYFAVDARLFPLSAGNTGIFYAPVKLSDHRVIDLQDGRTLPTEFYDILVDTDRATGIPLQSVQPGELIRNQRIQYKAAFYDSMFYRAYVGYSPEDLGDTNPDAGIPGFGQNLLGFPPTPAWNLAHFRAVYRTAYHNPFPDPANHSDAWRAMNYDEALAIQGDIQAGEATGVVDLTTQGSVANGIVFLRYYDGAWVNGTVRAGADTPLAGVRVTVQDELGTPHYVTTTDEDGRYSVLVPFGDVTLTASVGSQDPRNLIGERILAAASFPVSLSQAMRENVDADGDGQFDWILTRHIDVPGRAVSGTVFFDLDGDGSFGTADEPLGGATLSFRHGDIDFERTARADSSGGYVLPPVPTGAYEVLVTASGRTVAVPSLTLGTGAATRVDVAVPFGELDGFAVDATGSFVPGASIDIRDEAAGTTTTVTTSSAGFYSLRPLLEGNFTLAAGAGELASVPVRVRVTPGEVPQNLTLVPSGRVAGTTRLFGQDQPFASIEFQRVSNVSYVRVVQSDGSAAFAVTLPAGEWNVNGRLSAGTALYAHLGRAVVVAGATTTYHAMFVDGARLEGVVTGVPTGTDRAQIALSGTAGEWWIRAGQGNGYLVYLPKGPYTVQAFTLAASFYGSVSLTSSRSLELPMESGTSASARVFRDLNGDGTWQAGEEVPGASVRLVDDLGRTLLSLSDESGVFRIVGSAERTFTGRIRAPGFDDRPLNGTIATFRAEARYRLTPTPVAVRGALLLDGSPLRFRSLAVTAEPLAGGAVGATTFSDSNGGFELALVPGQYEIHIDENVSGTADRRYQNLEPTVLLVRVGAGSILRDVDLAVRSRVTGQVLHDGSGLNASVSFRGPDDRNAASAPDGTFETYLRDGAYDVAANSADEPDDLVALAGLAVSGPTQVDVILEPATDVTGLALSERVGILPVLPITFERLEGGSITRTTESGGRFAVPLPAGTYAVRLDAPASEPVGGITRFFRYAFSGSLAVPAGPGSLTFNLDATRSLDNTSLSGTVRDGGSGVDASIAFFARGDGAIPASTTAAADGTYAVSLAPGTYDVHATRPVGSAASLGTVAIPHAATHSLDLDLRDAHALSGVVTDPSGARTTANVTIEGGSRLEVRTDVAGAYEALLPSGSYIVTATRTGSERGIPVEYRATADVVVASDVVANLPLQKVVVRGATLTWDVGQRQTIRQGESVDYTIDVRNAGNVADTFTLSGRPSDWGFTFLPSTLSLGYGTDATSRASVSVTIRAPAAARVVHGPIALVATSSDGATEGTVNVDVFIERVRSLSVRVNATSGVFDGRFLNYTVDVRNEGNDQEAVTVLVANPGDLASSGWTARLLREDNLGTPGLQLTDLPVNANGTTRVRLELRSATGPSDVTVVIQAYSQDAPNVASTTAHVARLPTLEAPEGVGASGPNVAAESALLPQPLFAALVAALAAVAAGVFMTRRRR